MIPVARNLFPSTTNHHTVMWMLLTMLFTATQAYTDDSCAIPPNIVKCANETQHNWFYDAPSGTCRKYLFSNCLLGNNSFASHSECKKTCGQTKMKKQSRSLGGQPKKIHKCQLPSDKGNCLYHAYKTQWLWHFNPQSLRCEQFLYSGCGGNANRFDSKKHCWHTCGHLARPSGCSICNLTTSFCVQKEGKFTCECRSGFAKDTYGKCADVDECVKSKKTKCHPNANCINSFGTYSCACKQGFIGNGFSCKTFEETRSEYTCGPLEYYDPCGTMCRQTCESLHKTELCVEKSSAVCLAGCLCRPGFVRIGAECQPSRNCYTSVDLFTPDPAWFPSNRTREYKPWPECSNCHRFASCLRGQCQCNSPYKGDEHHCERPVDKSDCEKCHQYASCSHGQCECKSGYVGDGITCEDVDECQLGLHRCSIYARCANTIGSFLCKCRSGWAGDGYFCTRDKTVCNDVFDRIYRRQCWLSGQRLAHYYYNQMQGECAIVQYGGCESLSRNIFPDLITCNNFCNKSHKRKSPRSHKHRHSTKHQRSECFDSFDPGYGAKDPYCSQTAGLYYFYNVQSDTCNNTQYYQGCGGNGNRFRSFDECLLKCNTEVPARKFQIIRRSHDGVQKSLTSCFAPLNEGFCAFRDGRLRVRFYYNYRNRQCEAFDYAGCGGNSNRFGTLSACRNLCGGLIKPASYLCMQLPEYGNGNDNLTMFTYNLKLGKCVELIYSGQGGNTNRFETEEDCYNTCIGGHSRPHRSQHSFSSSSCTEPWLPGDCGQQIPAYHYDPSDQKCRFAWYSGCGATGNLFYTHLDCENKCIGAAKSSAPLPIPETFEEPIQDSNENNSWNSSGIGLHPGTSYCFVLNSSRSFDRNFLQSWPIQLTRRQCLQFRYSLPTADTKLLVSLCIAKAKNACMSKTLRSTTKQRCFVMTPFVTDDQPHLYTWGFSFERDTTAPIYNSSVATQSCLKYVSTEDCSKACRIGV